MPPLLVPVQRGDDVTRAVLDGARRAGRRFEEEDLLLDVGSQQEEVHELADAGAREAQRAGKAYSQRARPASSTAMRLEVTVPEPS